MQLRKAFKRPERGAAGPWEEIPSPGALAEFREEGLGKGAGADVPSREWTLGWPQ